MIEYKLIMTLNGALMVLGIAYVTLIFNKLKSYTSGKRHAVFGPLFGGILISIGFLSSWKTPVSYTHLTLPTICSV